MKEPCLDPLAQRDIDRIVERVLLDAGFRAPPVDIARVLATLRLDPSFYDLKEPSLLRRVQHRVRIGTRSLTEFFERVRLRALLLFDERQVLLDSELPAVKHDWAYAHEAGHELIPWHRDFCRGDTLETLDPAWHETIEAEANYAASGLLFCGKHFLAEAREVTPDWNGIRQLQRLHRKSLLATTRRYVRTACPKPALLLVSTAPWNPQPSDQAGAVRYLIGSAAFEEAFAWPDPEALRRRVDHAVVQRRGGPVGSSELVLQDLNRHRHLFLAETFYNQHYLMTLFVHQRRVADVLTVPGGHMTA